MLTPPQLIGAVSAYNHPLFKAVLALHILAAVVWVGGGVTLGLLGVTGRTRDDEGAVGDLVRAGRLRQWCFLPASIVLIGCGFGLVAIGGFSLRDVWLDLALGGWFVALAISTGYLVPETDELSHRALRLGADSDDVRQLIGRLRFVGGIESLVLVLVVIDMVVRP